MVMKIPVCVNPPTRERNSSSGKIRGQRTVSNLHAHAGASGIAVGTSVILYEQHIRRFPTHEAEAVRSAYDDGNPNCSTQRVS